MPEARSAWLSEIDMDHQRIVEILKREMLPAMGCTEPAASALAGARAMELFGPDREYTDIKVYASRDMVKNAMGVGIPNCSQKGILVAVSLGLSKRDSSLGLNILSQVSEEDICSAGRLNPSLSLMSDVPPLYVGVRITGKDHYSYAVISGEHDRFSHIEVDGKVMLDLPLSAGSEDDNDDSFEFISKLSMKEVVDFSNCVPFEDISFVKDAILVNLDIARQSISGSYGLEVGKTQLGSLTEDNLQTLEEAFRAAASYAAAGSDARMSGCSMPVIINSGSGNQGLTVTIPPYIVGRFLRFDFERISRAVCISELVGLVLTAKKNRLSALCGAFTAAIGTACAYVYLLGGSVESMDMAINVMVGNLTGIICDGAKNTCALKIYSCLDAAAVAAKLAMKGMAPGKESGIVGCDSVESIDSVSRISSEGMDITDKTILSIMLGKASGAV